MQLQERIDLRLSKVDKELIKQAASISGDKSVSNFIVQIIKEHSKEIIEKNKQILASDADTKLFFDTVLNASATPNNRLIEAAKRYKIEYRTTQ